MLWEHDTRSKSGWPVHHTVLQMEHLRWRTEHVPRASYYVPTEGGVFFRRHSISELFFECVSRFSLEFYVFGQFWWLWRSGWGFLSWHGVTIVPTYDLEVDFWTFWDTILYATRVLLVNNIIQTNYSKRLRQPYVDLRRRVHLKHQNLFSKCSKKLEQTYVGFQIILLSVYRLNFDGK